MELKRLTVFIINHLYFTLLLRRFVIELIRKYLWLINFRRRGIAGYEIH